MTRKVALPLFFAVTLAVDQITKILVQYNFRLFEEKVIIPGFFNLKYVLNPGAAFGILQNQSPFVRKAFLLAMAMFACGLIIALLRKEFQYKVRSFAYVAVLSGAAGNAIDRIREGYVVDFLDFYIGDFHWYTFNVADCYITVGVFILILDMMIFNKEKKK